jgi:hypothetical protein
LTVAKIREEKFAASFANESGDAMPRQRQLRFAVAFEATGLRPENSAATAVAGIESIGSIAADAATSILALTVASKATAKRAHR